MMTFHKIIYFLITASCLSSCMIDDCYRKVLTRDDLFYCIIENDIERARYLYHQGQSPYNPCSGSLLHTLSPKSSPEIIDFVSGLSLNIEYEDSYGSTPVFYYTGDMLNKLLKQGANVNHHNKDGETPLYSKVNSAIWAESDHELQRKMNDIDLLLRYGAIINEKIHGKSILDNVLTYQFNTDSQLILLYPLDRSLSNREKVYHFLRARGARISAEIR